MRNPLHLLTALCSFIVIFSGEMGEIKTVSSAEMQDAKGFSLPSLNGQGDISLSDFKGKPVMLNFWASWCSPCRREMPFFENTWKDYEDKGVVFIGIDVMDEKSLAQKFTEVFNIPW